MRVAAASLLLAVLSVFANSAMSCVELQGIVPGGGEDLLDLTLLVSNDSLGTHPLAPLDTFADPPTDTQCSSGLETPIDMRLATALDAAMFSIASMFDPNGVALDIFGDKETSDARRRCQPVEADESGAVLFDMHVSVTVMYATAYITWKHRPGCKEEAAALMEALGCPLSLVDVIEGDLEPDTDTPWGLAKAYIDEAMSFLSENDGWNADGGMGGKEVNRIPFTGDFTIADSAGNKWTGYAPRNTPYKFELTKSWQPLMESDGFGYITTQEHVTPHIGVTGRFLGFKSAEDEEAWGSRELNKPPYTNRYGEVAREVLEASKLAADDLLKQFAIVFFDDKSSSLLPLKIVYFLGRSDTLSIFDFISITVKSQLAIYNGVVLAWREKATRNELGDEMVEAFAGPTNGVKTIKASEWEPYIRTMPHSEYPSGSSCLCEAFTRALIHWAGEDVIDPPLEFPPPELGGPIVTFTSWSEISQMCGDSRVWAGLHFELSRLGWELCGGEDMAVSIAASIDALIAGDESAAVFDRSIGELMLRPL